MPRWSVPTSHGDIVVNAATEEEAARQAQTALSVGAGAQGTSASGSVGVGASGTDAPRMSPMAAMGLPANAAVQLVTGAGQAGANLANRITGRQPTTRLWTP